MHAKLKSGFSFRIASFLVLPNAIYLKHLMLGYNDSVDEELNDGSLNFDNSLEMPNVGYNVSRGEKLKRRECVRYCCRIFCWCICLNLVNGLAGFHKKGPPEI